LTRYSGTWTNTDVTTSSGRDVKWFAINHDQVESVMSYRQQEPQAAGRQAGGQANKTWRRDVTARRGGRRDVDGGETDVEGGETCGGETWRRDMDAWR
jgi:hypothetical protein